MLCEICVHEHSSPCKWMPHRISFQALFVTRHSISLLSFGGGGPGSFHPIKTVQAQGTQWTITDVQFTRDGRNFIYSSINPTLHLCNVSAGAEQHVAMRLGDGFGVWSMRISEDGTQVVAGTNNSGMVLYDMQRECSVADFRGVFHSQFLCMKRRKL